VRLNLTFSQLTLLLNFYADPPEETSGKSDSDSSEPEQKLLKYAADNHKQVSYHGEK
jgi:hypothetical protein